MTINRLSTCIRTKTLVKADLVTAEDRLKRGDVAGAVSALCRALRNMQAAVNAFTDLKARPRRKVRAG
jgi:hypothetical protein